MTIEEYRARWKEFPLSGDYNRAHNLCSMIMSGELRTIEPVMLLGCTIAYPFDDPQSQRLQHEMDMWGGHWKSKEEREWPFAATSDEDRMLLLMAW